MRIIRSWQKFPKSVCPNGTVVLVGSFDGLHLGHQALINLARSEAKSLSLPVVLVTFEPSPKNYFSKKAQGEMSRLLSFYDKSNLLDKMGIDFLLILKFNQEMINLSAESFLEKLNLAVQPKIYCLGEDFKFGQHRTGDITTILNYASQHNQTVKILPTIEDKQATLPPIRISSTLLKTSLATGDLVTASRLLNRPYKISGKVSPGKQLGQTIGMRTANIKLKNCPIPLRGVYAVRIRKINQKAVDYFGVANIGFRPTVHEDKQLTLEVHIFNQNLFLYGQRLEVEFIQKIRDEKKFADIDALKKQIKEDAKEARIILKNININ
jgi:riboflavin kinase/FMN adenylyltransferase